MMDELLVDDTTRTAVSRGVFAADEVQNVKSDNSHHKNKDRQESH
eukprot:CAMPEP_0178744600 /NCGR_PEP_ID=MMETSP0744-20121128/6860_1 /TAXON_ID=913974 /ORGANISM="Nitzschia punctata, Strain CCMP561" /LENGTH=44 /DNA_ID= /DNA_START= /DNA_END= /DNA_ORIENTATION=